MSKSLTGIKNDLQESLNRAQAALDDTDLTKGREKELLGMIKAYLHALELIEGERP